MNGDHWLTLEHKVRSNYEFLTRRDLLSSDGLRGLADVLTYITEEFEKMRQRRLFLQYYVGFPNLPGGRLPKSVSHLYDEVTLESEQANQEAFESLVAQANKDFPSSVPYVPEDLQHAFITTNPSRLPVYRPSADALKEVADLLPYVRAVEDNRAYLFSDLPSIYSGRALPFDVRISAELRRKKRKEQETFGDIPPGDWIEKSKTFGFVNGDDEKKFSPIKIVPQPYWVLTNLRKGVPTKLQPN